LAACFPSWRWRDFLCRQQRPFLQNQPSNHMAANSPHYPYSLINQQERRCANHILWFQEMPSCECGTRSTVTSENVFCVRAVPEDALRLRNVSSSRNHRPCRANSISRAGLVILNTNLLAIALVVDECRSSELLGWPCQAPPQRPARRAALR
jgi:hypothetical protein